MKESAEITIIPYCWLTVCKAFFSRYPNPYALHVLSEDTLHREIKDGKFLSKRILCKTATTSLPNWIKKIVRKPQVLILEETIVDLCAKRLISFTRNLDHKKLVIASETTEYVPSYVDTNKTVMTRRTIVRSPLNGLTGRMIERVCHVGAIRNAKKAVQLDTSCYRDSCTFSLVKMEEPPEEEMLPSLNFILWLYVVYTMLHLFVFLFDYFLWKTNYSFRVYHCCRVN